QLRRKRRPIAPPRPTPQQIRRRRSPRDGHRRQVRTGLTSGGMLSALLLTANVQTVRRDLVIANRVLAREGILDAFGHVSARHPDHADRFLLAWARAPELIEEADLMEFALDGRPLDTSARAPYLERFIHAAVYE